MRAYPTEADVSMDPRDRIVNARYPEHAVRLKLLRWCYGHCPSDVDPMRFFMDTLTNRLFYDCLMGCWTFWSRRVMYGMETDGYIHS